MRRWLGNNGLQWLVVLLGAFVLILPALHNGYPLLHSDSGNYIEHAFTLVPAVDRPLGYSWFIRCVTWLASFWPVVFFQGLIGSWLVLLVLRTVIPPEHLTQVFLSSMVFLGCFSGLGWYASFITPDIFTSYLPIIFFLLLFSRLKPFTRGVLYLLSCLIITTHFSNLLVALGLIVIVYLFKQNGRWNTSYLKIVGLIITCVVGFQVVCLSNLIHHDKYTFSRSSYVFLMGRLSETGILNNYLQDNCHLLSSSLCEHKDRLPKNAADFIWSKTSPFQLNGKGWAENNEEYEKIVKNILSQPRYYPSLMFQSGLAAVKQLTRTRLGAGTSKYEEGSGPYYVLRNRKPNELNEYLNSRQYFGLLELDFVNAVDGLLLLVSILMLIWFLRTAPREIQILAIIVLASYCLNAIVTGSLANVYDRLQARMTWPVVLLSVPVAYHLITGGLLNDD